MMQPQSNHTAPTLLVIQTAGPDSVAAREALDVALNAAALDIPVQLVLQGNAILNLVTPATLTDAFNTPSVQKKYGMLELFDVPAPLVASEDLQRFGLTAEQLSIAVTVLSQQELHQQHAHFTQLLRF